MDIFKKETLIKGRPTLVECLEIDQQVYAISRGPAAVLSLEDEWYDDVRDPESVVTTLKSARPEADVFTFWQRLPDVTPRFAFHQEWDCLAALRVTSFDYWWTKQIGAKTRNLIRKAEKKGLEVREATYDDDFVRGMTDIFNEVPIRQGRRFWHYGKDFETVKRQFSRYLSREELIGAYYGGELVGFVMLGHTERYGVVGQVISKLAHRDKSVNNALIGKSVDICAKRALPYLVYSLWGSGTLSSFKGHCGFEPTRVPRYYVPLTSRGALTLRFGLHRGWKATIPEPIQKGLRDLRSWWLARPEA